MPASRWGRSQEVEQVTLVEIEKSGSLKEGLEYGNSLEGDLGDSKDIVNVR